MRCTYGYYSECGQNHDYKFKSLAILLMDEDGLDDNEILIVSNKEQEKRDLDLVIFNPMD